MFKKSDDNPQLDIFSSPTEYFKGAKMKKYLKDDSWHNLFRKHVVMRVDEPMFNVLFSDGQGAPNASIRVLVGMMILKEGQGWSDGQLFENCGYNLLVRSALGLMSLEDAEPVPSTYYLFRRKLVDYQKEHGIDLMKECQSHITGSQALEFGVEGKRVRMDSKLVGSNIAWYSRYELVHETLRQYLAKKKGHASMANLPEEMLPLVESIQGEKGDKVVYRSTKAEVDARFIGLGQLARHLINLFQDKGNTQYQTLKTVFEQQYSVNEDDTVTPLENEKISPKSIQSPHDTECNYRNKDGNQVRGYSINEAETCDLPKEDGMPVLNLLTDTQVEDVSTPDNAFMKPALENTRKIVTGKTETVYADGAYHSPENQEYCQSEGIDIDLVLTAMQGALPRYDVRLDGQDENNLIVTDNKTGETVQSYPVNTRDKNEKKWKIKTEDGKWKQFDSNSIRAADLRRKLRDIPISEKNIRNNVEASIFQLGYHYPNDKSRYRGLAKHKLWAYSRTLWINLVRIVNYVTQISQRALFGQKTSQYMANLCFNMYIIVNILLINKNNQNRPAKPSFSAI